MGGYYTNSNILKKDSENRWDAAFGLFGNNWRASISVTDITNNAARDFPSYPEPGRMYFMRLHYHCCFIKNAKTLTLLPLTSVSILLTACFEPTPHNATLTSPPLPAVHRATSDARRAP